MRGGGGGAPRWVHLCTLLATLLCAAWAGAAPGPGDRSYEQRHVASALAREGLVETSEVAAWGEAIDFVRVVRFDVFRDGELIPPLFNVFHWLTVPQVIKAELLLKPGDPYQPARALETARNLRRLRIFQLATVRPVRDAQGRLGVLVVTRDLWSLRIEQGFQFTNNQFDYLTVQLTERNLLGRNQQATLRASLDPVVYTVGQRYLNRRIALGTLQLSQGLDVQFRRDDNGFDGVDFAASLSRPWYRLDQRFAFEMPFRYLDSHARQIRAGQVVTWDDPETAEVEAIPRVWRQRFITDGVFGRIQLGDAVKHRLSAGLLFSHLENTADAQTALPAANAASFERRVLPRSLTQVAPRVSWGTLSRTHRTFQDLRSFGVSEDARMGVSSQLSLSVPLAALGSTYTALEVDAGLSWTTDWAGDGVLDLLVAAEGRVEGDALINRELLLRARVATPSLGGWGRLTSRVDWLARAKDTRNRLLSLGGDNGLRGYPSQFFQLQGADRLRGNLEFRSRPAVWSFLHLGGVAFYDAGDVYVRGQDFTLRQSVGLGARVLFPQFNREVYRVDLGVPVDGSGFMINLSAGSSQAVPLTPEEDGLYQGVVGGFYNQD